MTAARARRPRRDRGDGGRAARRRRPAADVDYINAHGTSTPMNDRSKRRPSRTVFNGSRPARVELEGRRSATCSARRARSRPSPTLIALRARRAAADDQPHRPRSRVRDGARHRAHGRPRESSRCRTRSGSAGRTRPRPRSRMTVAATALAATDGTLASRLERLCDAGSFWPLRTRWGTGSCGRGRVAGRTVFALGATTGALPRRLLSPRRGASSARSRSPTAQASLSWASRTGGARLQEGPAGLHAYAGIFRHQARATVPQITVVAGPCAATPWRTRPRSAT